MNLALMAIPRERSARKSGADAKRQKYHDCGRERAIRDDPEDSRRFRDVTNESEIETASAARNGITDPDLRGE
jgi:hypothetical protein